LFNALLIKNAVGADAHIGPKTLAYRADVGIGPYECVVLDSAVNSILSHLLWKRKKELPEGSSFFWGLWKES
jgi:hypothetical protein